MRTFLSSTFSASIILLLCIGCGKDGGLPTAPPAPQPPPQPPPSAATGFIWGHVVTEAGGCVIDAAVEIVAGPNAGQKVVQKEECSAWDYDLDRGFYFKDLPLGVTIRLRATKEGYQPRELETMAFTGTFSALTIVLRKE